MTRSILAAVALFAATPAFAAVHVVDCALGPFPDIDSALAVALPGDSVAVYPCSGGAYPPFTMAGKNDVAIVGVSGSAAATGVGAVPSGAGISPLSMASPVVVDGTLDPTRSCGTIIGSTIASVHHLTLQNCALSGLEIIDSQDVVVESNLIWRTGAFGVFASPGTSEVTVSDNTIALSIMDGIRLDSVQNARLLDNIIGANQGTGIYVANQSGRVKVYNNEVRVNRRECIRVEGRVHRIERNTCRANNLSTGGGPEIVFMPLASFCDGLANQTYGAGILDMGIGTDLLANL